MLQQLCNYLSAQADAFSQTDILNTLVTAISGRLLSQQTAQAYQCGFFCEINWDCELGEYVILVSRYPNCTPPFGLAPQGICCESL